MTELQKQLFALQDVSYRDFHSRLMPNIDKETIIGIRTPVLRKFAKEMAKAGDYEAFLDELPHTFYEENNLHGFLLEDGKDYDETVDRIEQFLPHVDNWATCDMMNPKIFKKHLPKLLTKIRKWLGSEHTYTVRFAIDMLMIYYLDEAFSPEYLEWVAAVKSDEYYVKMAVAWYFQVALAKQYDAALPYIERKRLEDWTHNKAIQKAIESYRITEEQKAYLRTLKKK